MDTNHGIIHYDEKGKIHVVPSRPDTITGGRWRYAYGQERPKIAQRWKTGACPFLWQWGNNPANANFAQRVNQARLSDTYNAANKQNPIPAKGATGGSIGGVACSPSYIEGLFDCPEALFEQEHFFCVPGLPNGKMPFSNLELRQIMREVAIGIYVHSTVPFSASTLMKMPTNIPLSILHMSIPL